MIERILPALFLSLGALPGGAYMIASTVGEYEYFLPYRYAGFVFLAASPVVGFFICPTVFERRGGGGFAELFYGAAIAYSLSWLCLVLMNISPLCIGLENGDGHNSLGHCIFGAVFGGLHFAIAAMLGALPWAGVYALVRKRRK